MTCHTTSISGVVSYQQDMTAEEIACQKCLKCCGTVHYFLFPGEAEDNQTGWQLEQSLCPPTPSNLWPNFSPSSNISSPWRISKPLNVSQLKGCSFQDSRLIVFLFCYAQYILACDMEWMSWNTGSWTSSCVLSAMNVLQHNKWEDIFHTKPN